ncbi:MAG: sulfotransferase [Woeseiaceae bacterium]
MALTADRGVALDADAALSSAKQSLTRGEFAAAIDELEALLERFPGNEEALYLLAVCSRYGGRIEAALDALDRLLGLNPACARGYQERGHVYRDSGDASAAIEAYEKAVGSNPALLSSWQNLAKLQAGEGRTRRAAASQKHADELSAQPKELLAVMSMIYEGKLDDAEPLCRAYLKKHPKDVVAMRLLAKIGAEHDVLDDAEFLLESCLEFEPGFTAARYDYARILYKRQRFGKALVEAERLLCEQPGNADFQLVCANAVAAVGDFDRAFAIYDRLIDAHPDNVELPILKGHALKSYGDAAQAIAAYRQVAAERTDHGDAWWSLANIKTYAFTDAELEQMRSAEADPKTSTRDRYQLCFALGKSFEDRDEIATAFDYYSRGNALKLGESGYRAEYTEAEFARQKEVCTKEFFEERRDFGVADGAPIFVVGMPRAGSTLIEQILASHPMIDGTIELPNVLALAHKLAGRRSVDDTPRYPAILESLEAELVERFAQDYLESTQVYRHGAPFFTDKMPNNFRHIGLIQLMFPNAKIIDARREAMACCLSNFKQLFGQGQHFTYGLEEVGRYYRGYVALMDHWLSVLPGKILCVQYEDVVDNLESEVHRLLDFLGLPFDQRCIEFHKTERAVHTPSAEQVRQPIYREGVEQWKNFERFLEPLKHALGQ